MTEALLRLSSMPLLRYLFASIGAVAADFGCYLAFLHVGIFPAVAAAAAYCVGIVVHWFFSSRAVFAGSVARRGIARARQKAFFLGSAFVGLGLTTIVVWCGDLLGGDPRIAKLGALALSFGVTWLLRSRLVFR